MKKHLIFFLIAVSILMISCEPINSIFFPPFKNLLRLQNNSGYNVEVKPKDSKSIFITKGNTYETDVKNRGETGLLFGTSSLDSLLIIFNNEKILVQYCSNEQLLVGLGVKDSCRIENNLKSTAYSVKKEEKSKKYDYSFTWTLTNKDYDRAAFIKK